MRSAAEAAPSFLYLPALAGAGSGQSLTLELDEARYVAKVVRAREGERLTATDGAGLVATLVVESSRPEVVLRIDALEHWPAPAPRHLLCGAPEGERGDWLVEKSAELGVTHFQPVDTDRVSWPDHLRLDRWERLAVAALRQSRSAWLMRLAEPLELAAALVGGLPESRWLADPAGVAPGTLPETADAAVAGAVGPSSGFSETELNLLEAHGFVFVKLAHTRLRTETAALALASHWAAHRSPPG